MAQSQQENSPSYDMLLEDSFDFDTYFAGSMVDMASQSQENSRLFEESQLPSGSGIQPCHIDGNHAPHLKGQEQPVFRQDQDIESSIFYCDANSAEIVSDASLGTYQEEISSQMDGAITTNPFALIVFDHRAIRQSNHPYEMPDSMYEHVTAAVGAFGVPPALNYGFNSGLLESRHFAGLTQHHIFENFQIPSSIPFYSQSQEFSNISTFDITGQTNTMSAATTNLDHVGHAASVEVGLIPYTRSHDSAQTSFAGHLPTPDRSTGRLKNTHESSRSNPYHREARNLETKSGATESAAALFSISRIGPEPKRKRTRDQRNNRTGLSNAGGACISCRLRHTTCSPEIPCGHCRNYWPKFSSGSTSFMWTCTVRRKLSDFTVPGRTTGLTRLLTWTKIPALEAPDHDSFEEELCSLRALVSPVFAEDQPWSAKSIASDRNLDHTWHMWIHIYVIIYWKQALLCLSPKLSRTLEYCEDAFAHLTRSAFKICDEPRDKKEALEIALIAVQIVRYQTRSPVFTLSTQNDLGKILEAYLAVFCAQIFGSRTFVRLSGFDAALAICLDAYIPSCLPKALRGQSKHYKAQLRAWQWTHREAVSIDGSPCILKQCRSEDERREMPEEKDCCCGWFLNLVSPAAILLFGHSKASFARHFHNYDRPHAQSEADETVREIAGAVFAHSDLGEEDLRMRMAVFRQAFQDSLRWILAAITVVMQHKYQDSHRIAPYKDFLNVETESNTSLCFKITQGLAFKLFCGFTQSSRWKDRIEAYSATVIDDYERWAGESIQGLFDKEVMEL